MLLSQGMLSNISIFMCVAALPAPCTHVGTCTGQQRPQVGIGSLGTEVTESQWCQEGTLSPVHVNPSPSPAHRESVLKTLKSTLTKQFWLIPLPVFSNSLMWNRWEGNSEAGGVVL